MRPSGAGQEQAMVEHAAFRAHVMALLHGLGGGEAAVRGELALELPAADGRPIGLDLREILLELRATPPEACDEVLSRWIDAQLAGRDGPGGWDEAAPLLRTALRTVSQAEESARLGVPWIRREALPCLVETAVLPLPDWTETVTERRVAEWGKGAGEVLARARENSAGRSGEAVHRHDDGSGTTWHVDAGDLHGAGRLVLPGFLASFEGRVDGRPIAVVPERGHLHVGGDRSDAMVLWLAGKARTAFQESPAALSAAVYTSGEDGRPAPYAREGTGRVSNEVRLGHLLLAAREYAASHADLQRELGAEALVAGMELALRQADGRPFTWTSYAEGIPGVLPIADAVGVGHPGGPPDGWTTLAGLEAAGGTAFRRVTLGGLAYLDARGPLPERARDALRGRLVPEPPA